MRILIRTLFFTLLAASSNCIVPDVLAGVFQRHRQLQPISYDIEYYSVRPHELIPIYEIDFENQKITRDGFIIGVAVGDLLRPIYDIDRLPVIVRENGRGNTRLTPEEIQQIPYNSYDIYDIIPGFRQNMIRIANIMRQRQRQQ